MNVPVTLYTLNKYLISWQSSVWRFSAAEKFPNSNRRWCWSIVLCLFHSTSSKRFPSSEIPHVAKNILLQDLKQRVRGKQINKKNWNGKYVNKTRAMTCDKMVENFEKTTQKPKFCKLNHAPSPVHHPYSTPATGATILSVFSMGGARSVRCHRAVTFERNHVDWCNRYKAGLPEVLF